MFGERKYTRLTLTVTLTLPMPIWALFSHTHTHTHTHCQYAHFFRTQHQSEDARARVSRPPCCGCFQCWADVCRVCKKLRKFDDAELERQFVQHHYRSPLYFGFITVIAVLISLSGVYCLFGGYNLFAGLSNAAVLNNVAIAELMSASDDNLSYAEIMSSVTFSLAGVAFLLSGIWLIVAARIRHIRERHWDKMALLAAVVSFVAFALLALEYQFLPSVLQYGNPSNYTNVTCPGLLGTSGVGLAFDSAASLLCEEVRHNNLFFTFVGLWIGPLCLPVFGLDFRRYAPLLVTEIIINFFIILVFAIHDYLDVVPLSVVFTCIVLTSQLWTSMSSESAARGAWIRQQNW